MSAKPSTIVTVTYVDDRGIDTQSVSTDNIVVAFGATVSDAKISSVSDGGKTVVVTYTVVGVTEDAAYRSIRTPMRPTIYVPMAQGATMAANSAVPNVLPADLVAPTITATPIDPRTDRGERQDERAEVSR